MQQNQDSWRQKLLGGGGMGMGVFVRYHLLVPPAALTDILKLCDIKWVNR